MLHQAYTISALADEFDISNRTIRFYEEKGLLSPQRTKGNQRRYTPQDRFRLKWILRGKRFGYSLEEISKMLGLTDTRINEAAQIKTTLSYGEKKILEITDRIQELKIMLDEMMVLKQALLERLAAIEKTDDRSNRSKPKPAHLRTER